MKKYLQFFTICAVVIFTAGIPIHAQTIWTEYSSNPIFGQGTTPAGPKAYYPSVVYDASSFSGHGSAYLYKMWYGTSSSQTGLAYSNDGIFWTDQGDVMTNGYHAQVIYDASGFGGSVYYKMWYWGPSLLYSVGAIRYAESVDGVTWSNDQPLQNGIVAPIIGEPHPAWNYGSYGPSSIFYNPTATNTGTDPFGYTYTMYYDGTTGGTESIGLAYSTDGITWNGHDANTDGKADPVLDGVEGTWVVNYSSRATIIKNAVDDYEMWYSGGIGAMNNGIGYATSTDGINWIKDASNPIFHKDDGITWRDSRTYCPSVIKDGTTYKMWFTGKDIANGDYSIGYATGAPPLPPPTEVWVDDDYCDTCPNDGHIWGYDVFDNIQDGIDAVDGSTVYVGSGTYAGNITVNKSLTILGDPGDALPGPGANAPIIDGGLLPGSAFFIANGVTNVTIKGFEIRNFTSNNTGIGNGISAWQASTSYITIQDNYFHHLGYNGVLVGNDGAAGDHTNWLIKGNVIEEFYYIGFELTNTSFSSIEDNVIHMNTPIIGAIFSSARRSETGLTIKNNQIDGTPSTGFPVIYMYAYDLDMLNPNLDNVLIEGNTIATVGTPFQICIRDINTGTITGVQAHNNSLSTFKNLTSATIDASSNWWGSTDPTIVSSKIAGVVDCTPIIMSGTDTDLGTTGFQPGMSILTVHALGSQVGSTGRIQEGINLVSGSTVNVAAGTYNENVLLNKSIVLSGQGPASTILTPSVACNGTGVSISAANAELKNLTVTNYTTGIAVSSTGNEINNVDAVSNCNRGLELSNGTTNLSVLNSRLNNNTSVGFRKGTAAIVSGFTMDNCEVKGNRLGCFVAKNKAIPGGIFNNVSITNSDFSNNLQKGMYFEALSNAIIDHIVMDNSGTDANYGNNNGIDINLKHGSYSNITIQNSTITNCGALGIAALLEHPAAIAIKARDDGGYSSPPATLDNVIVKNNIISGPRNGIRFGESGTVNAGPTNVSVTENDLGAAFAYKAFVNNSSSNDIGTCNWWGAASGPTHTSNPSGTGGVVTDNVTFLPWLVTSDLNGSCIGGIPFQAKSSVLTDLQDLFKTGTGDKKTDKILENAIKHLEKSLADELWEDNYHLSSKGIKVFEEEKKAVHELMKISALDVNASILALVEADRMLAQTAIDDEAVNEKDKAKAEGEMDKASFEITNGDFDKAIEHYKQAWHQATKALKNLAKSYANSDVEEGSELVDSAIPEVFGLRENYPNPFNPTTLISYDLPEASQVSMTVYDMMGRQVKSLVQEFQPAGNHSVIWNATNDNGDLMSGGMYFYQIRAGLFQKTHKMILLK